MNKRASFLDYFLKAGWLLILVFLNCCSGPESRRVSFNKLPESRPLYKFKEFENYSFQMELLEDATKGYCKLIEDNYEGDTILVLYADSTLKVLAIEKRLPK